MKYCYEYPRPALTVDCVVFGVDEAQLEVLLIRRGAPPFEGCWALPGGFVDEAETVEEAARRELQEETGLSDVYLEQLATFSRVDRDPRARVVSVAHIALVRRGSKRPMAASDAAAAEWVALADVRELAFDHAEILAAALTRLRSKITYQPLVFELLPARFTLSALQRYYELILERPLDKRNFRKKVLALGIIEELKELVVSGAGRPARLYRFSKRAYRAFLADGGQFMLG